MKGTSSVDATNKDWPLLLKNHQNDHNENVEHEGTSFTSFEKVHTHTQPWGLGVHGNFFAGPRRIRKVVVHKVKGILYQVISSRSFQITKSEVRISPAAEKSNKSTPQ